MPWSGFIEVKAPGKGADPRKFSDPHDKAQWEKLKSLPNLLYTDGNAFSLWRDGELVGQVVQLEGDIETSGAKLAAPAPCSDLLTFCVGADTAKDREAHSPKSAPAFAGCCARRCSTSWRGNRGLTASLTTGGNFYSRKPTTRSLPTAMRRQ